MNEKINLQELTNLLSDKTTISKKDAEAFLREFFGLMADALIADKQIKIRNLGLFKLIEVEDRESVNVRTGERVLIPAHSKVSFSPAKQLSLLVNEPFALFEPVELATETENNNPPTEEVKAVIPEYVFEEKENDEIEETEEDSDEQTEEIYVSPTIAEKKEEIIPPEIVTPPIIETPVIREETSTEEFIPESNIPTEEVIVASITTEEPEKQSPTKTVTQEKKTSQIIAETHKPEEVSLSEDEDRSGKIVSLYPEREKKKKRCIWPILFTILIMGIIALAGFYVYENGFHGLRSLIIEEEILDEEPDHSLTNTPVPTKEKEVIPVAPLKTDSVSDTIQTKKETTKEIVQKKEAVPQTQTPPPALSNTAKKTVIKEGQRLTLIALKEYGHKAFWVYLYKENESKIQDPDNVPIGLEIVIPPAKKYNIDKDNPESINKAKELARAYLSK